MSKTVELHPHQKKAVDDMHNGCVLMGDVGTGKTITSLAYALLKEPGRDIYVITTAKKRDSGDWEKEAALLAVPFDKIKVDSWNNISKYSHVDGAFFIFDEQRLVGTGAWVKAFYKIAKTNRWVLLSATPGDTWMDYVPVFIANGFYKNITEFRQEHVIYSRFSKYPKVDRYVNPGLLNRRRKLLLVEMPVVRETVRHIETIECDYDVDLFERVWKKRWHVYEERPLKDAGELFRVGRKVVASDSSRLRAVSELAQRHPRLIVFYNFDYELEMLRGLAGTKIVSQESVKAGSRSSTAKTVENPYLSNGEKKPLTRSDSTSSASIQSPTLSDTELRYNRRKELLYQSEHPSSTNDTSSTNDAWDYLLSPEGMAANSLQAKSSNNFDASDQSSETLSGEGCKSSNDFSIEANQPPFPSAESDSSSGSDSSSSTTSGRGSFAVAEWNGHKHEPIPETDRWLYLVQYTAGSEGWNCTSTDAMVFYSLTYSYKQFYQAQGRIDRLDTKYIDLHYYVLASKSMVEKAVWRALKAKKDFNLRGFSF